MRLADCIAQLLPADQAQVHLLEGWLALYASALGPSRTEQGSWLLETLQQHARERVDAWLAALEAEGALRPGARRSHATTVLAMVDGLCLDLLVAHSGTTVAQAREILFDVITRVVVVER